MMVRLFNYISAFIAVVCLASCNGNNQSQQISDLEKREAELQKREDSLRIVEQQQVEQRNTQDISPYAIKGYVDGYECAKDFSFIPDEGPLLGAASSRYLNAYDVVPRPGDNNFHLYSYAFIEGFKDSFHGNKPKWKDDSKNDNISQSVLKQYIGVFEITPKGTNSDRTKQHVETKENGTCLYSYSFERDDGTIFEENSEGTWKYKDNYIEISLNEPCHFQYGRYWNETTTFYIGGVRATASKADLTTTDEESYSDVVKIK